VSALLSDIETYYDAVPRSAARTEQIGEFTLFIKIGPGFPYYARPSLGAKQVGAEDVQRVRNRQRELGVPQAFEWVAETTPTLTAAAEAAGLVVSSHPLMCWRNHAGTPGAVPNVEVRLVSVADDLPLLHGIAHVAFAHAGTAAGSADLDDARNAAQRDPATLHFWQERLQAGLTVMAVALLDGQPVGVGSHQPFGSATEVVGVAVLPAFRRRGIAAALTSHLVADAMERRIRTIFLSAGDETIGRIYERVGFRHIGSACIAEA
jgi:ribosomal protein S18 acetylase RimI-like enzyme